MQKPLMMIAAALFILSSGCRYRLPALKPPKFDPDGAATAAMEQYDSNSDGKIDQAELKTAPGITFSLGRIDGDNDGSVTANELSAMIQEKWLDADGGIMRVGTAAADARSHQHGPRQHGGSLEICAGCDDHEFFAAVAGQ